MDVKYDDDDVSVESDIYIPIRTIVTIQKWIRMAQAKNKYKNMLFYKGIVVRYQRKWFCKILRLNKKNSKQMSLSSDIIFHNSNYINII